MDKKWLEKLFHEKNNLRPTDKTQHVINIIFDKYNQQNYVIQEEVKYSIKLEERIKKLEAENSVLAEQNIAMNNSCVRYEKAIEETDETLNMLYCEHYDQQAWRDSSLVIRARHKKSTGG